MTSLKVGGGDSADKGSGSSEESHFEYLVIIKVIDRC
jgi:hypothetical protein